MARLLGAHFISDGDKHRVKIFWSVGLCVLCSSSPVIQGMCGRVAVCGHMQKWGMFAFFHMSVSRIPKTAELLATPLLGFPSLATWTSPINCYQ